jgi:hypothetical protein
MKPVFPILDSLRQEYPTEQQLLDEIRKEWERLK